MSGWNDSPVAGTESESAAGPEGAKAGKARRTATAAAAVAVAAVLALGGACAVWQPSDGTGAEGGGDGSETEAQDTGPGVAYDDASCVLYDEDGLRVTLTGTASDGDAAWLRVEVENSGTSERAVSLTRVVSAGGGQLLQSGKAFAAAGGSAMLEVAVPGNEGDALPAEGYVTVQGSSDLRYAGAVLDSKAFELER